MKLFNKYKSGKTTLGSVNLVTVFQTPFNKAISYLTFELVEFIMRQRPRFLNNKCLGKYSSSQLLISSISLSAISERKFGSNDVIIELISRPLKRYYSTI